MRIFALAALAAIAATSVTPASAYDYPYCLSSRDVGFAGDCNYSTFQQCQASASGRAATCDINPRAAFNQQQPRRRDRAYRERYRD